MWNENKQDRIRRRSEMYVNGELSLDDFIILERIDQDEEDHHEDETLSLTELDEMRRTEDQEEQIVKPVFSITKEEFDALPLYEQMKLNEEHPDEIMKLLKPVEEPLITLTKEEYQKMSLYEQNHYYNAHPTEIKSLVEGTVDSVTVEGSI